VAVLTSSGMRGSHGKEGVGLPKYLEEHSK